MSKLTNWREVYTPPFKYWDEGISITDANELHVLDVRGWGHLTGQSGLRMSSDAAKKIQDEFGREIADALNAMYHARRR